MLLLQAGEHSRINSEENAHVFRKQYIYIKYRVGRALPDYLISYAKSSVILMGWTQKDYRV